VLQYADDTLILLPADAAQVQRLRQLLDDFADATGLKINYNKSTMVPINVSSTTSNELQALLGCKLETFPQTYLGLPLSTTKLNISAFSPLIGKADKHLAGWQNQFLNSRGRAILINSVLDGTAAYLMAANQMPKGVLDALDSRRRAFLWTGAAKTTGSQCLVVWPTVCQTKEKGGLGVRELHLQNQCLLLKLIHKLHHPGDSAWAQWARTGLDLANLTGRDAVGAHWDALRNLLPFYRCITSVVLGDGRATSFWDDHWHGSGTLTSTFPSLASHVTGSGASVSDTKRQGIRAQLVPRLSRQAAAELTQVEDILDQLRLSNEPDDRLCPLMTVPGDHKIHTSRVYQAIKNHGIPAAFAKFVWSNRTPPKVQHFCWLVVQDRIKCRTNLKRKHILEDDTCPICDADPETATHLLLTCPFSLQLWNKFGIDVSSLQACTIWNIDRPGHIDALHFETLVHLICWMLWKHRNGVVFNNLPPSASRLAATFRDAAHLWQHRFPAAERSVVEQWCHLVSS
jgi:hypothetical protein